jgi:para-aminobenzoate synthetase/4-amino-4-deoxychorismate lyase
MDNSAPANLAAPAAGQVVIHHAARRRWLRLARPVEILAADRLEQVVPTLARVERRVRETGVYAAGFVSYEAAPAFDPALAVHSDAAFPLVWFGLYAQAEETALPPPRDPTAADALSWTASVSPERYRTALDRIKHYIRAGHTYQVNFTFRLTAPFAGDPWKLFLRMNSAQTGSYGAFVNTGDWVVCCASPELFFLRAGNQLTCRPMKGTAARGLTAADDRRRRDWLQTSAKNRAENVMIVDMVRNDLGRIARNGTVRTRDLFTVEPYPTVWQMTATVTAESQAGLVEIFRALFPPASITGAPKPRTMQLIAELEDSPRKLYTGTIGLVTPDGDAQFNVAIRTALLEPARARIEYGVGGGIVWDSCADDEFAECQTKAAILTRQQPAFRLLESLLWTPAEGCFLLDAHRQRLLASAEYFSFRADAEAIRAQLLAFAASLPPRPHKIRALLARDGGFTCEAAPIEMDEPAQVLRVRLAVAPVDTNDVFLYHKTTHRAVYEQARRQAPGGDDVLLWNERGELTEFTNANLVAELDGRLYTPPVACGLLAGVFRGWLLDEKQVEERVMHRDELASITRLFWVNSVRRWRVAQRETAGNVSNAEAGAYARLVRFPPE